MQTNIKVVLLFLLYFVNNTNAQTITTQNCVSNIDTQQTLESYMNHHNIFVSTTNPDKTQKKQGFKERFRSIATSFALVSSNAQNISVEFMNESGTFQMNEDLTLNNTAWAGSIGSGFEYDIYKNLFFSTVIFQGIGTFDYGSVHLGLGYKWQINDSEKKPIRLVLALDYVYATLLQKIRDYDNTDPKIEIAGKSFKKDNIKAELFSRRNTLLPKLSLEMMIAKRWDIFADVGYFIPVSERRDGLFFTDGKRSSWIRQIGQQRAKIDLDDSNISLKANNVNTNTLPFQTNLFLSFGFKKRFN